MSALLTRRATTTKPIIKMWKEGFANQAVRQTAGFYTVHPDYHFNHIWLGTEPEEADRILSEMNDCINLVRKVGLE